MGEVQPSLSPRHLQRKEGALVLHAADAMDVTASQTTPPPGGSSGPGGRKTSIPSEVRLAGPARTAL